MIFKSFPNPPLFWWICAVLFWAHQIAQRLLNWSFPFLDSYLDPFLCMPILLGLLTMERKWVMGKDYNLPILDSVVIVVVLSLIFELGFPKWSDAFYYDSYDFVAYGLGALAYIVANFSWQTKKQRA